MSFVLSLSYSATDAVETKAFSLPVVGSSLVAAGALSMLAIIHLRRRSHGGVAYEKIEDSVHSSTAQDSSSSHSTMSYQT